MVDVPPPPDLSSGAIAVYLRALADGAFHLAGAAEATGLDKEEVVSCRDELLASRLLQRTDEDGRLVPVNPERAAAQLAEPLEEVILSFREAVDHTRERLMRLMPAYSSRTVSGHVDGGLEVISDAAEVQWLVNQAAEKCSREMLVVQPGAYRDPVALQSGLPQELATLSRGVRFRVLYQHTTRTQLSMRSYVSTIVKAGAQVRTADQLAERMFIFDRELAFIPKRSHRNHPPGAVVVREPVLISFLCALFDQFWVTASPFITEGPGYQNVSDDLRRAVLGLLGQGLKDEVVARRLGMSVRTCRRHIATLMQELGVESRFQAGVRAAQLGLIEQAPLE